MALKRRRDEIDAREGMDLGRLARRGASSLSYAALVVVAVALTLGLSIKMRKRWDLSATGGNVLAPQTLEILDALEEPVEIYPLFTTGHESRESYWYLLQLYRDASDMVRVEFIDPVERPGRVNALGLDASEENARRDGITVVMQGNSRRVFEGIEEEHVTNAILDVGSSTRRVVGFARGYAERDPESRGSTGMALAAVALDQEYYELADVRLAEGIPDEITALILAGPRNPIPPAELEVLAGWLERGGRLLAMTDPGFDSGINQVLERWGLRATSIPVIEPRRTFRRDRSSVMVHDFTDHHVVRGFGPSLPVGLPVVGSVRHFEPGDPLVFHRGLARSSDFSWELHPDGTREGGPFTLAAASWRSDPDRPELPETRVILIGDSDFVSNEFLPYAGNRNLFLNCVGWLTQQEALVSIRRQQIADQTLRLSPLSPIISLAAFGAPVLVALAGVAMFLRRRKL